MGDWYLDSHDRWVYDAAAPSPGANPAVTMIFPATADRPNPDRMPPEIGEHAHGAAETAAGADEPEGPAG